MDSKLPTDDELDGMSHVELAEVLKGFGATDDDLKSADLNSKDKRRAKVREMASTTTPPPIEDDDDLAAMTDDALAELVKAHFFEGVRFPSREAAIQGLATKRNALAPASQENEVTEPSSSAVGSPVADLDTGRTKPPRERKTLRQIVAGEVRAAHARGDHGAHAALHNFEIAVGDFRRAAERLTAELPDGNDLRDLAQHIVNDL